MTTPLLTIAGIYDGKTIQPLEAIATDKKQRVLITFLEEPAPVESTEHNGNGGLLPLSTKLAEELQRLAQASGTPDAISYAVKVLEKEVQFARDKEFVYKVTDEVRAGMLQAGITEEEILEDFNRFRRTLSRD